MKEIGPVDYMIVAFPGNEFKGEIAPALAELTENGTIRIIDLAFVGKNAAGEIVAFELTELDPEVAAGFEKLGIEVEGLFNEDDLMAAGEELEPNSSAALLVWENVWARDVAQKMRDAGGILLDFERLPHEVVQAAREAVLSNTNERRPTMPWDDAEGRDLWAWRRGRPLSPGRRPPSRDGSHGASRRSTPIRMRSTSSRWRRRWLQMPRAEPDYMDELTQLAQLRDQGILTPEEFEAKKKQVLGL